MWRFLARNGANGGGVAAGIAKLVDDTTEACLVDYEATGGDDDACVRDAIPIHGSFPTVAARGKAAGVKTMSR